MSNLIPFRSQIFPPRLPNIAMTIAILVFLFSLMYIALYRLLEPQQYLSRELRVRRISLSPPPLKLFIPDRSKAVLVLWLIISVIGCVLACISSTFCSLCLRKSGGQLLRKSGPLVFRIYSVIIDSANTQSSKIQLLQPLKQLES